MPKQLANPFYVLLLMVGAVFAVTACCYGVMMVQQGDAQRLAAAEGQTSGLIRFMDEYGFTVLMWEVGVLAVCTVAAIGTDDYWLKRAAQRAAAGEDSIRTEAELNRCEESSSETSTAVQQSSEQQESIKT